MGRAPQAKGEGKEIEVSIDRESGGSKAEDLQSFCIQDSLGPGQESLEEAMELVSKVC